MKQKYIKRFKNQKAITLVEVLVSMVLGLMVTLAAIGVFISNNRTSAVNENLSRLQESTKMAFELMVKDLREAGGNPCSKKIPVANTLTNSGTDWWATWTGGLRGYEDGALAGTSAGTDAVELAYGSSSGGTVVAHNPNSATFDVIPATHGFLAGEILMACDYRQASVFQMTGPNSDPVTNGNVVHNSGAGTPGNCSKGLGFKVPMDCSANGTPYEYGANSTVVRLHSTRWYVAGNADGGQSLFRIAVRAGDVGDPEEIISGVTDLQLTYLVAGTNDYVDADAVGARWPEVVSIRVSLGLTGDQAVGTEGEFVTTRLNHTVALRSRLP